MVDKQKQRTQRMWTGGQARYRNAVAAQQAGPGSLHDHVTKTRFRIAVGKETPVSPAP